MGQGVPLGQLQRLHLGVWPAPDHVDALPAVVGGGKVVGAALLALRPAHPGGAHAGQQDRGGQDLVDLVMGGRCQPVDLVPLGQVAHSRVAVVPAQVRVVDPHRRDKAVGVGAALGHGVIPEKGGLSLVHFLGPGVRPALAVGHLVLHAVAVHIAPGIQAQVGDQPRPDHLDPRLALGRVVHHLGEHIPQPCAIAGEQALAAGPVGPCPQLPKGVFQLLGRVLGHGDGQGRAVGQAAGVHAQHAGIDGPGVEVHQAAGRVVDGADMPVQVVPTLVHGPGRCVVKDGGLVPGPQIAVVTLAALK